MFHPNDPVEIVDELPALEANLDRALRPEPTSKAPRLCLLTLSLAAAELGEIAGEYERQVNCSQRPAATTAVYFRRVADYAKLIAEMAKRKADTL